MNKLFPSYDNNENDCLGNSGIDFTNQNINLRVFYNNIQSNFVPRALFPLTSSRKTRALGASILK